MSVWARDESKIKRDCCRLRFIIGKGQNIVLKSEHLDSPKAIFRRGHYMQELAGRSKRRYQKKVNREWIHSQEF